MTALEFVDIDKDIEISAYLTEKNIFDMVMNKEANEENEKNQKEAPKTVTSSGFNSSRNYFNKALIRIFSNFIKKRII